MRSASICPACCGKSALSSRKWCFIHPVYLRGESKRLWEYSFFEASPHLVGSGLTSDAELKQRSAALAAVAADETISIAQARMPAVWARKPG